VQEKLYRDALRDLAACREALLALRQQVEDTVMVAKTDEDAEGFVTAYRFQTGAIHRLLAKAREPLPDSPAALRALDDGGATP
jgi:hypothetical protein